MYVYIIKHFSSLVLYVLLKMHTFSEQLWYIPTYEVKKFIHELDTNLTVVEY